MLLLCVNKLTIPTATTFLSLGGTFGTMGNITFRRREDQRLENVVNGKKWWVKGS